MAKVDISVDKLTSVYVKIREEKARVKKEFDETYTSRISKQELEEIM